MIKTLLAVNLLFGAVMVYFFPWPCRISVINQSNKGQLKVINPIAWYKAVNQQLTCRQGKRLVYEFAGQKEEQVGVRTIRLVVTDSQLKQRIAFTNGNEFSFEKEFVDRLPGKELVVRVNLNRMTKLDDPDKDMGMLVAIVLAELSVKQIGRDLPEFVTEVISSTGGLEQTGLSFSR
ncbi:MAG: hypothetical protein AB1345_05460 [Chloroflexota bacterium]